MTTTKTPQAAQGLADHVIAALREAGDRGMLVPPWRAEMDRTDPRASRGGPAWVAVFACNGPIQEHMATEDARLRIDGYSLTEDVVREAVASWIGWSDLASASRSVHPRMAPTSLPAVLAFAEHTESLVLLALAMQRPNVSVCKAFELAIEDQVGDPPSGIHLAAVEAIEAVAEVTGLSAREALPALERAVTDIRLRLRLDLEAEQRKNITTLDV